MKKAKKNGMEIKPYKGSEPLESRKKMKFDSDLYSGHMGGNLVVFSNDNLRL